MDLLGFSDEDLMAQVAAGARPAFEELYRRYKGPIYRYLRSLLGSGAAEDAFQEVFLNILKYRASYDPSLPFKPWAFAIARNRASRECWELTQDAGNPGPETLDAVEGGSDPAAVAERNEARQGIREAMAALPATSREILHLKFIEQMPYPEICRILDVNPGAARERVRRALELLNKAYWGTMKIS